MHHKLLVAFECLWFVLDSFGLQQTGNCRSNESNDIHLDHAEHISTSVTLVSPCYPNDFRGCSNDFCRIRFENIPENSWIGIYLANDSSVSEANVLLDILTSSNKGKHWARFEIESIEPGLFYNRFQASHFNQQLAINYILNSEQLESSNIQKFKITVISKC